MGPDIREYCAALNEGEMTAPVVVSVNAKDTPGINKVPHDVVTLIAGHGVEGDYHAGPNVRHRSRAAATPDAPNLRQVHLMHAELFDELAAHGITVTPGAMGENITTRGLALFKLAPGARLHFGDAAIVEITGLRNPCKQLNGIDENLLSRVVSKLPDGSIVRRAGIMGIVIEGGLVRPGDAIRVETPAGVTAVLEPV